MCLGASQWLLYKQLFAQLSQGLLKVLVSKALAPSIGASQWLLK